MQFASHSPFHPPHRALAECRPDWRRKRVTIPLYIQINSDLFRSIQIYSDLFILGGQLLLPAQFVALSFHFHFPLFLPLWPPWLIRSLPALNVLPIFDNNRTRHHDHHLVLLRERPRPSPSCSGTWWPHPPRRPQSLSTQERARETRWERSRSETPRPSTSTGAHRTSSSTQQRCRSRWATTRCRHATSPCTTGTWWGASPQSPPWTWTRPPWSGPPSTWTASRGIGQSHSRPAKTEARWNLILSENTLWFPKSWTDNCVRLLESTTKWNLTGKLKPLSFTLPWNMIRDFSKEG